MTTDTLNTGNRQHQTDYRRVLAATPGITLNGRPAKISGVYNPTATIWTTDDNSICGHWSWESVEKTIQHRGGRFTK